ncbi:MAG: hypothetical protein HWN65_22145 [Candidatus Helarchaeota archaeon]|nr:hypothetical protein [Candidatus Helarchaeota archaeon]
MQNIFKNSFPFSKTAAEHLKELDIDIRTLPIDFPTSFKEAYKRVQDLIENNVIPEKVDTSLTSQEILIYAIMRVFIEILNEDLLRNRFAEAYSKRTETLLLTKDSKTIMKLASKTFNWELLEEEYESTRKYEWKLRFNYFLEVAPSLMANDWKLINQELHNGWISLTKEKVIRLLAEKTKSYVLRRKISREEIPKLPAIYDSYLEDLNLKIGALKKRFEAQRVYSDEVMKSAYPPCINSVLKKAEKGENLTHTERLFLTFFLLNIGHPVSEVVDVFKNQPDFKEDMTRYQVEFAAGKRGSGTKYTSFGCPKLISYGVCKRELDPWCAIGKVFNKKPFKNPLSYYRAKIFIIQREKERENEQS